MDVRGNVLAFSGELFEGPFLRRRGARDGSESDTAALLEGFEAIFDDAADSGEDARDAFIAFVSRLRGPWSLVYRHEASNRLWFGRDVFGRRSLLLKKPSVSDPRVILSSRAPSFAASSDFSRSDWEEIEPGLYSVDFNDAKEGFKMRRHEWNDPLAETVFRFERERAFVRPDAERVDIEKPVVSRETPPENRTHNTENLVAIDGFIAALEAAVERRVALSANDVSRDGSEKKTFEKTLESMKRTQAVAVEAPASLGILFSGGVDSMLLAALAHRHVPLDQPIDLLTVCFNQGKSPDRESALDGVAELEGLHPERRWRLVRVDATLADVDAASDHLDSVLHPANTVMDRNIGAALWFAARGEGWIEAKWDGDGSDDSAGSVKHGIASRKYRSSARVLLLGQGADEQCAGYSRHRTAFNRVEGDITEMGERENKWDVLSDVLKLDVRRLWKRNLGRDDRLVSDHGREARFPFLDEGVVARLLTTPLRSVANLGGKSRGDKMLIRAAAHRLGMHRAASRPKRAIQFGSRISKAYNLREFGSGNGASGTLEHKPSPRRATCR